MGWWSRKTKPGPQGPASTVPAVGDWAVEPYDPAIPGPPDGHHDPDAGDPPDLVGGKADG